MNEPNDIIIRGEPREVHNTCGLDLVSLLSRARSSIGEYNTHELPQRPGTIGTATKLCDENDNCLFVTANHVVDENVGMAWVSMRDGNRDRKAVTILKRDPENDLATFVLDGEQHATVVHSGLRYNGSIEVPSKDQPVAWMGFGGEHPHRLKVSAGLVSPEIKLGWFDRFLAYFDEHPPATHYTCARAIGLPGQSGALVFGNSGGYAGIISFAITSGDAQYACYAGDKQLKSLLDDSFKMLSKQHP